MEDRLWSAHEAQAATRLEVGAKVLVRGLVKARELNGRRGKVVATGSGERWVVELTGEPSSSASSSRRKAIRGQNLAAHPDWSSLDGEWLRGSVDEESEHRRRGVLVNSVLSTTDARHSHFRFLAFSLVNTYIPIEVDSVEEVRRGLVASGMSAVDAELTLRTMEGDFVVRGGVRPVASQTPPTAVPAAREYAVMPGYKALDLERCVAAATRLEVIRAPYVVSLTGLVPAARAAPHLLVLDLGGSPRALDGDTLEALASLVPHLQELTFGHDNRFLPFLDVSPPQLDAFLRAHRRLRFVQILQRFEDGELGMPPDDPAVARLFADAGLDLRRVPRHDVALREMADRLAHYWRLETEDGWAATYYARPDFTDFADRRSHLPSSD